MPKTLIIIERKDGRPSIPLIADDPKDEDLAKRLARQKGAEIKRVTITEPKSPLDKEPCDAL